MKTETTITEQKTNALAAFLQVGKDEISEGYNDYTFGVGKQEYLVLTDEEADAQTKKYIEESLWGFTPSFLAGMTRIDQEVFEAIQANDRCESNNPAITSIIKSTCGVERFVEAAINADGRGHFLSGYDGEENEQGEFFIYRTN